MNEDQYYVWFNGNNLYQVQGVELYNHNFNSLPARDIKIYKVARRDLSIITSAEYATKEITVEMEVCSGTREDTENTLIFMKSLLQPQNSPLAVMQGGARVTYTATMNEFNIEWNAAHAYVTIVFLASDPIGVEAELQTMAVMNGITQQTSALGVTVNGSATAYPLIGVTVNSVTGGTGSHITISNGRTNQGIRVDRDWVSGDYLQIDSDNMEVTVNGVLTDFSGMFPKFPAGSQQIKYTDSFTARSVDVTATYKPRIV